MAEIKPALTDEQWTAYMREAREMGFPPYALLQAAMAGSRYYGLPDFHDLPQNAAAALALHLHPSGFTWEMVDALGEALSSSECDVDTGRLADQAVRCIAALLPPRRP